jgi:hypothetical protein
MPGIIAGCHDVRSSAWLNGRVVNTAENITLSIENSYLAWAMLLITQQNGYSGRQFFGRPAKFLI